MPSWLNDAGGLRYHLRAFRYTRTLWEPFRWALGSWLLGFQPPAKVLVVVGPSGGYCMQPFLFERFERLVLLEPDPLARVIFERRLAKVPLSFRPRLEFISDDYLIKNPEKLLGLLDSLGDAAILFSNIVGQISVLVSADDETPELARVRKVVNQLTRERPWASFHDRVSGLLAPSFEQPLLAPTRLTDQEVVEHLFEQGALAEGGPDAALTDHLTQGFFPQDLPHAYFKWELLPGAFHVIEAVCDSKNDALTAVKLV